MNDQGSVREKSVLGEGGGQGGGDGLQVEEGVELLRRVAIDDRRALLHTMIGVRRSGIERLRLMMGVVAVVAVCVAIWLSLLHNGVGRGVALGAGLLAMLLVHLALIMWAWGQSLRLQLLALGTIESAWNAQHDRAMRDRQRALTAAAGTMREPVWSRCVTGLCVLAGVCASVLCCVAPLAGSSGGGTFALGGIAPAVHLMVLTASLSIAGVQLTRILRNRSERELFNASRIVGLSDDGEVLFGDVNRCEHCGYSLGNAATNPCPECGQEVLIRAALCR